MTIKRYSIFLDWSLTIRWFSAVSRTVVSGGESYPPPPTLFAEAQLAYSTAPDDRAGGKGRNLSSFICGTLELKYCF